MRAEVRHQAIRPTGSSGDERGALPNRQRKVLTPNDFCSLASLADRILGFQERYQQIAKPFEWKFTRQDLARLMSSIPAPAYPLALAA